MVIKVDVTIVCKAEKDNVFDGFDDEKIIKILDESAGKVNNECCKVSIQPNLRWQKLKEWLEDIKNPISVSENFNYRQIELIDNILLKMQELEVEDEKIQ